MEIEMILSSALEDIISPHDLAAAIGIAHGAKLWLRRDNTGGQRAATKVIVHCEKPTASRLRHRFSTSRAYVHAGWPASLKFVGMRPVVTGHHFPPKALLLHHQGVNAVASMAGVEPTSSCIAATTHTTSSLGVEAALELVARGEAADLRVPGISELYQEFQRGANETSGDVKGVRARRRRSRRRRAHANEGKVGTYTRRVEEGKLFLDEIATRSSEEYGGSSSSEMKRGSSADSFVFDDGHRVGHGEGMPRGRGQHNRRHRHRRHSRARSEEEKGEIKPKKQQRVIAARRRRRHHWRRHQALACTTRSVADVASALDRISREYLDAPRSVGRTGVLSILAKMYADGAAFAGNRQRDIEMLDRLGVTRWSARIYPNLFPQETTRASEAGLPESSKKAREGWFRILGRVIALVRNIADFGTFVQIYVAAVERDRLRVPSSSAVAVVAAENCARGGRKDRGRRVSSPSPHLGATDDDGDNNGEYFSWKARPRSPPTSAYSSPRSRINAGLHNITKARGPITCDGRGTTLQAACKGADADTGTETPPQRHVDDLAKNSCQKVRWLFPACHGDSGGRAFARHAICGGGGVHGLVTLEAAAAIIRDAGKYVSMERVWRWFCDRSNGNHNVGAGATKVESASSGRGRLLRFEDFVEMCDGLREHMEDVPIMSDDAQSNIHTIT